MIIDNLKGIIKKIAFTIHIFVIKSNENYAF